MREEIRRYLPTCCCNCTIAWLRVMRSGSSAASSSCWRSGARPTPRTPSGNSGDNARGKGDNGVGDEEGGGEDSGKEVLRSVGWHGAERRGAGVWGARTRADGTGWQATERRGVRDDTVRMEKLSGERSYVRGQENQVCEAYLYTVSRWQDNGLRKFLLGVGCRYRIHCSWIPFSEPAPPVISVCSVRPPPHCFHARTLVWLFPFRNLL